MSGSHKTMIRPPHVGPALSWVGNDGHFWGVGHLEGVWQLSHRPVHAPLGRGTIPMSLWDVTHALEVLGLVKAVGWT